jgi:hypothetical protein
MNPETNFDLSNVDSELLEKATSELTTSELTTSEGDAISGYPPSCEKGGMWEF